MKNLFAVLLVVSAFLVSGCGATFYSARFPILEKPDRPVLENISGTEMKKMSQEAQTAVAGNFDKLIKHVVKLESAIDIYNANAAEHNKHLQDGEK